MLLQPKQTPPPLQQNRPPYTTRLLQPLTRLLQPSIRPIQSPGGFNQKQTPVRSAKIPHQAATAKTNTGSATAESTPPYTTRLPQPITRLPQPNVICSLSILYVVMLVQQLKLVRTNMANKGSGRGEAARLTCWKHLKGKGDEGVGKGRAPMHVNSKPALLHYVTVVMSDLRSAIEKLTRVEYEIMHHILWGRKIPVALVKHLETTRKGLIEPTYKLGRLADTWKPLVTVFYDDALDEHEFSAIGDQEMFDYVPPGMPGGGWC